MTRVTSEATVSGQVLAWARLRGYRVAWGALEAADLACHDVVGRRNSGEIDAGFYASNLGWFRSPETPALGRVLVVAMPRPAHSVWFEFDGSPRQAIIPPTYVRYRDLFDELAPDLQSAVLPWGRRLERAQVPLKSLAVRLGLVRYGRNNLTYAPDLGSYVQLFGYFTDAPLSLSKGWLPSEPELLATCESCTACRDACPTGAIGEDRVLLRAERCLTSLNESPDPWPAWLPSNAHSCLVGCLACQTVCPENPLLAVSDTGVAFTAEETVTILDGRHDSPGWDALRRKLDVVRLSEEAVLGRNLRARLDAGRPDSEVPVHPDR